MHELASESAPQTNAKARLLIPVRVMNPTNFRSGMIVTVWPNIYEWMKWTDPDCSGGASSRRSEGQSQEVLHSDCFKCIILSIHRTESQ